MDAIDTAIKRLMKSVVPSIGDNRVLFSDESEHRYPSIIIVEPYYTRHIVIYNTRFEDIRGYGLHNVVKFCIGDPTMKEKMIAFVKEELSRIPL